MAFLSAEELKKIPFKKIGINVKISVDARIYNPEQIEIGDNSRIDDFCVLSGKIIIGKYVHIAPACILAGSVAGIYIEDFANFSYQITVFSRSDDYHGDSMTNATVPEQYKKVTDKPVTIGRHVIIGAGSTIFLGVNLGEGCAIGAMSMINKSTDPWKIYAGSPARLIKDRSTNLLALEKDFLKTLE
jgi:acetyltransferase-like isoleucine patch superfamily enzyme